MYFEYKNLLYQCVFIIKQNACSISDYAPCVFFFKYQIHFELRPYFMIGNIIILLQTVYYCCDSCLLIKNMVRIKCLAKNGLEQFEIASRDQLHFVKTNSIPLFGWLEWVSKGSKIKCFAQPLWFAILWDYV